MALVFEQALLPPYCHLDKRGLSVVEYFGRGEVAEWSKAIAC